MSKQQRNSAAKKVKQDRGTRSAELHLFNCLVDRLSADAVEHITPRMVSRLCKHIDLPDINAALKYFCGDRVGILEIVVAKLDDHGQYVPLDEETSRACLRGEQPIDRDTGEPLIGTVSVYFRGTDHLKEILSVRKA